MTIFGMVEGDIVEVYTPEDVLYIAILEKI